MVKVIVPNKSYNGYIADVPFYDGVGEFQDEKLANKIADQFGFEIVAEPKEVEPKEEEPKEEKAEKPSPKRKSKKVGE